MIADVAHDYFAQSDPLAAFARDPLLWGPLAGHEALLDALRAAYSRVVTFTGVAP